MKLFFGDHEDIRAIHSSLATKQDYSRFGDSAPEMVETLLFTIDELEREAKDAAIQHKDDLADERIERESAYKDLGELRTLLYRIQDQLDTTREAYDVPFSRKHQRKELIEDLDTMRADMSIACETIAKIDRALFNER